MMHISNTHKTNDTFGQGNAGQPLIMWNTKQFIQYVDINPYEEKKGMVRWSSGVVSICCFIALCEDF